MSCLFEQKFVEICDRCGVERNWSEGIFVAKPVLMSPTDFLYELVKNRLITNHDKEHARDVIQYSLRSCYGYNIYDRCDFFFYMADKFAKMSEKNVFLIQFDVKSCFKLAKIISSEDIFRIHNFILDQSITFFENKFDFVYGFDATRNDDSYFVVGGNITSDEITTLLNELQALLHNSIIRDIKNDVLYKDKPVVTYGFVQLGQGLPIKNALKTIEKAHQQSDKVKKISHRLYKSIYDYQGYYVYDNPYTGLESSFVQKIYFLPDDYTGVNKERLLLEKIKQNQQGGVFVHFKFQNSSGVNKLLISKEFGIIILKHYISILKNILSTETCDNDVYFVGLNSFILHLHEVKTIDYITNLFKRFNNDINEQINDKYINEYFHFTGSQCVNANLKIADIPSKRGLNSGISTINYLTTPVQKIKSTEDLIKFKNLALSINQTNINEHRIASL